MIETKVKILSDEFHTLYRYNPIEHIKTRIKTPESIIRKLERKGLRITYNNMIYLNDVAGIRIICSFLQDIYRIVEMFEKSSDLKILEEKDYINEYGNAYIKVKSSREILVSTVGFLDKRLSKAALNEYI